MERDETKAFYLGLDVGGTHLRMACADSEGNRIGEIQKTKWKPEEGPRVAMKALILSIYELLNKEGLNKSGLKGIGISLAAIFDRHSGAIIKWPNHQSWNGYPFKKMLQKEYLVPIILEGDCNCAALAEGRFGNALDDKDFLYVNIGTGIGSSIILNKNCYIGTNGFAGEIGHMRLTEGGATCKCGSIGCLQAYASGPAFMKRTEELALELGEEIVITNVEQIYAFKLKGKAWALNAVDEFTTWLCMGIGQMVMTLDLTVIVLGGGVIGACPKLIEEIRVKLDEWVLPLNRKIEIRSAKFKDDGGIIGATSLVLPDARKEGLHEAISNY